MKRGFLLIVLVLMAITLSGCEKLTSDAINDIGAIDNYSDELVNKNKSVRSYVTLSNDDVILFESYNYTYIDSSENEAINLEATNLEFVGQLETGQEAVFIMSEMMFVYSDSSTPLELEMRSLFAPQEEMVYAQYYSLIIGDYIYIVEERETDHDNGDGTGYTTSSYITKVIDKDLNIVQSWDDTYVLESLTFGYTSPSFYAYTFKDEEVGTAYRLNGIDMTELHELDAELYYTINLDGTDVLVFRNMVGDYVTVFCFEDGTKKELQGVQLKYNNKVSVIKEDSSEDDFTTLYDKNGEIILSTDAASVGVYLGENRYLKETLHGYNIFDGNNDLVMEFQETDSRMNTSISNIAFDTFGDFTIGRVDLIYVAMINDQIIDAYQYIGMSDDYSSIYYYVADETGDLYIKKQTGTTVEDFNEIVVDDYFTRFNSDEEFIDRELYIGLEGTFLETRVVDGVAYCDIYEIDGGLLAGGTVLGHTYLGNETSQYLIYTYDGELVTVDFHDFSFYLSF